MRKMIITVTATVAGTAALIAYQPPLARRAAELSDSHGKDARDVLAGNAVVSWPGDDSDPKDSHGSAGSGKASKSGEASNSGEAGEALAWTDGPSVDTPAGVVQVRVGVENGVIRDVRLVTGPHATRHSVWLTHQAVAVLRAEVLNSQSADVDMISGATYTSTGYLRSLQAALDSVKGS